MCINLVNDEYNEFEYDQVYFYRNFIFTNAHKSLSLSTLTEYIVYIYI